MHSSPYLSLGVIDVELDGAALGDHAKELLEHRNALVNWLDDLLLHFVLQTPTYQVQCRNV